MGVTGNRRTRRDRMSGGGNDHQSLHGDVLKTMIQPGRRAPRWRTEEGVDANLESSITVDIPLPSPK